MTDERKFTKQNKMKNLLTALCLLACTTGFSQMTGDTIINTNGDTIIHVYTNSTAVFTYPVTTVSIVVKPRVVVVPPNVPPTVSAGSSQAITLPVNAVTLTGSASDPDGTIASYLWSQLSGPAVAVIASPTTSSTSVTGLVAGVYVFKLTATDNKGASAGANVNVTVNPAPVAGKYEGFGSLVIGGDNSPVVHVTTLSPTGTGSLTAAMGNNRKIVFDVTGVINGFRWTATTAGISNLTIDGGGITINGNAGSTFDFEGAPCHDFILKNIRFGGSPGEDYITITGGCFNFVIDHCNAGTPGTTGLAGDGLCDITAGCHDGTVQYCWFGKSTAGSQLIAYAGTNNITLCHNLYSPASAGNVGERNPFVHSSGTPTRTDLMVEIVNCFDYNWGRDNGTGSGYGIGVDYGGSIQCINNYGLSKSQPERAIDTNADPSAGSNGQCYAEGNVSGNAGINPNSKSNHAKWAVPLYAQVAAKPAKESAQDILKNVGCFPRLTQEQSFIDTIILP